MRKNKLRLLGPRRDSAQPTAVNRCPPGRGQPSRRKSDRSSGPLTRSTAIVPFLVVAIAVATGALLTAHAQTGAHPGGSAQRSGSQASAAFNDLAKRANDARENGRLDEAITFYGEALKIRQKWDEGWWY